MSRFYLIKENSLGNITEIDDIETSPEKVWSSYKTDVEIHKNKITKFEELADVDVANKKDKQLIAFSKDTGKFTTIDGIDAGEIAGIGMKQISKMGIVGSFETPCIVNIAVNTLDFKVPRVNILKYDLGTQNIIVTKNTFSNGESNDFKADDMIIFDGKVHLKTEYIEDYIVNKDETAFTEYTTTLDLSNYKSIEGFEDFEDGVIQKLKVKAIPSDRFLMSNGDIILSNAQHMDYFKLTAAGKNIKVICSVNSGTTWKTFKTDKWVDITLNVENVRTDGITIETFNAINDVFWNELITSRKIRFAYLFSIDDIADVEELDNLDIQYDGQGKWVQSKETDYDVVYASNTLLQIYVKFSGDIKINY